MDRFQRSALDVVVSSSRGLRYIRVAVGGSFNPEDMGKSDLQDLGLANFALAGPINVADIIRALVARELVKDDKEPSVKTVITDWFRENFPDPDTAAMTADLLEAVGVLTTKILQNPEPLVQVLENDAFVDRILSGDEYMVVKYNLSLDAGASLTEKKTVDAPGVLRFYVALAKEAMEFVTRRGRELEQCSNYGYTVHNVNLPTKKAKFWIPLCLTMPFITSTIVTTSITAFAKLFKPFKSLQITPTTLANESAAAGIDGTQPHSELFSATIASLCRRVVPRNGMTLADTTSACLFICNPVNFWVFRLHVAMENLTEGHFDRNTSAKCLFMNYVTCYMIIASQLQLQPNGGANPQWRLMVVALGQVLSRIHSKQILRANNERIRDIWPALGPLNTHMFLGRFSIFKMFILSNTFVEGTDPEAEEPRMMRVASPQEFKGFPFWFHCPTLVHPITIVRAGLIDFLHQCQGMKGAPGKVPQSIEIAMSRYLDSTVVADGFCDVLFLTPDGQSVLWGMFGTFTETSEQQLETTTIQQAGCYPVFCDPCGSATDMQHLKELLSSLANSTRAEFRANDQSYAEMGRAVAKVLTLGPAIIFQSIVNPPVAPWTAQYIAAVNGAFGYPGFGEEAKNSVIQYMRLYLDTTLALQDPTQAFPEVPVFDVSLRGCWQTDLDEALFPNQTAGPVVDAVHPAWWPVPRKWRIKRMIGALVTHLSADVRTFDTALVYRPIRRIEVGEVQIPPATTYFVAPVGAVVDKHFIMHSDDQGIGAEINTEVPVDLNANRIACIVYGSNGERRVPNPGVGIIFHQCTSEFVTCVHYQVDSDLLSSAITRFSLPPAQHDLVWQLIVLLSMLSPSRQPAQPAVAPHPVRPLYEYVHPPTFMVTLPNYTANSKPMLGEFCSWWETNIGFHFDPKLWLDRLSSFRAMVASACSVETNLVSSTSMVTNQALRAERRKILNGGVTSYGAAAGFLPLIKCMYDAVAAHIDPDPASIHISLEIPLIHTSAPEANLTTSTAFKSMENQLTARNFCLPVLPIAGERYPHEHLPKATGISASLVAFDVRVVSLAPAGTFEVPEFWVINPIISKKFDTMIRAPDVRWTDPLPTSGPPILLRVLGPDFGPAAATSFRPAPPNNLAYRWLLNPEMGFAPGPNPALDITNALNAFSANLRAHVVGDTTAAVFCPTSLPLTIYGEEVKYDEPQELLPSDLHFQFPTIQGAV